MSEHLFVQKRYEYYSSEFRDGNIKIRRRKKKPLRLVDFPSCDFHSAQSDLL